MGALALSARDVAVVAGEPRVKDVRLGECLGMAQPLNIRRVIEKNAEELAGHGPIHATREMVALGSKAKREITAYYLNEAQALLITMFSRTATAAQARKQIVSVYMAWRHGELERRAPDPLGPLGPRGEVLRQATSFQALRETPAFARALAHLTPPGRKKRYPKFWGDFEVRCAVIELHRQMTVLDARAAMIERFGAERTPSKSALHRAWAWLDKVWPGFQARIEAGAR